MPASGSPSLSATLASSSQSANASLANGLSNSLSATSSSTGNITLASSTTAAVIVPITSTLPSGQVTTMLETTSTTIALMGTGTYTASGYFVWNGTTTIPYLATPATASSSANITTAPGPAQHDLRTILDHPFINRHRTFNNSPGQWINGSIVNAVQRLVWSYGVFDSTRFRISDDQLSHVSEHFVFERTLAINESVHGKPIEQLFQRCVCLKLDAHHNGVKLGGHFVFALIIIRSTSASSSNPFPASSATATPTACGEHGNFTMDFDNLPNFQPNSKRAMDITQAPPVPNPYHHLTFSDGYVYAPQPSEPYLPSSEPHLAVFLANGTGVTARSVQPGEIGDGPYESNSAFWFDAFSAMMGCDNAGPDPCTIVFTGYTYSAAANDEIATYTQNATIAPCPALNNCPLQPVSFPTSFRSLSGVRMQAFVGNEERMFFLDDMELGWSNNTCQAGMTRQRYQ
ncbi:hypothetical protein LTR17_026467 [Elasticomyces elasticus]|nr:hypothetical protein LTR17_026467 [Elasticomyces elasticus]